MAGAAAVKRAPDAEDFALASLYIGGLASGWHDGLQQAGPFMVALIALGLAGQFTPDALFDRAGSWHGRNHHNFNEHPRSPKVGREASPRRRVCRIDPLVPNRIVIFEQTHVSDPDLGA